MALPSNKSNKTDKQPKLGDINVGQVMPSKTVETGKKLTGNVLKRLVNALDKGRTTFRVDGENYTVQGLASQLRPILTPSDRRRLLAGDKVKMMRPPTSGSGRMDVVFKDALTAKDGALVSKKKRSKPKTNNKKNRTGATKYGCGLFK